MGIIGILVYPNIKSKRKRGNRRVPLPFRGKRAENCSHNVGKSLGEGLAHKEKERINEREREYIERHRARVREVEGRRGTVRTRSSLKF